MDEFAECNAMPRYVVSATLADGDPRWPATVLRSVDEVAALKETEGGPIAVHGSPARGRPGRRRARRPLPPAAAPLLLGAGRRLFSETDKDATELALVEHDVSSNGVVKKVYDVVR